MTSLSRLAALRSRAASLDADIALLQSQRASTMAEMATVEAALLVEQQQQQQQQHPPHNNKRARHEGDSATADAAATSTDGQRDGTESMNNSTSTTTKKQPCSWRLLSEVQAEVSARRAKGDLLPFGAPGRIPRVYVDGCFDMMHSGHMNAVRQAKLIADSVGGVLVVGVHTDAEIERNKGPPVMKDAERLALVAAVKWVDELIFDTPYTMSLPFLDSIDAEYVVHGDDISINADGTDAYAAAREAGRMKVVKRTEGVSTTDLVGRLLLLTRSHHEPKMAVPEPVGGGAASSSGGGGGGASASGSGSGSASASGGPMTPSSSASAVAAAADAAAAAGAYSSANNISSSGVSQFLPTTWRLRQFSNGRIAPTNSTIVYIDGAFDLLHAAHVEALYAARNLGDFLIVGLHDDVTVNSRSGRNLPICSLHERALCVLALGCVDEVILGAPRTVTADLIASMNIHVVVGDAGIDDAEGGGGGSSSDASEAEEIEEREEAPAEVAGEDGDRGSKRELLQRRRRRREEDAERYAVPRAMGLFRRGESRHPLRLGAIVRRIIDNRARFEARNLKREKRELNYMLTQKKYIEEL